MLYEDDEAPDYLPQEVHPLKSLEKFVEMRFQLSIVLCFAAAALSSASPALHALQNRKAGLHVRQLTDHISPRPVISYTPKTPRLPPPNPPVRDRVCYVDSHNDGVTDDSPYIMEALQSCNNGGHVVFREGHEYFVATALDLTFLKSIDLGMQLWCSPFASTNGNSQMFKVASSSPMTQLTGRHIPSHSSSKM